MACFCKIIPDEVLKRFSNDPRLTAEQRRHFANAARAYGRDNFVRAELCACG